jgi:hypothetical protein
MLNEPNVVARARIIIPVIESERPRRVRPGCIACLIIAALIAAYLVLR